MVIATGNDFRAVEACGHTFAAKDGQYRGLTHVTIDNGIFKYWIDLPMAVGTVGGLTILHPLVKRALQMIGNPNSEELMQLIAVAGLAQNFAAVKSLVTVGIQQGHMKMHLLNIMNSFHASDEEKKVALEFFKDKVVSYTSVRALLAQIRGVEILEIN
jgi:hydroxymethylglutaryl-CoA reductase